MENNLEALKERLGEVYDLRRAAGLLYWDQATHMPSGGATARGRQTATLQRIAHEKFTAPALGELLEDLGHYEAELPYDSDEAALIRVTRREYERQARVPADFVAQLSKHSSDSYAAWVQARSENDFESIRPYLQKTLDLSRQYATFFPESEHPADPLIDAADHGMTAGSVREVFSELRQRLVPLVEEISGQAVADASCLRGAYDENAQLAFAEEVVRRFGYDFERGRHDLTTHPFAIRIASGDVRITTRIKENDLQNPLFSTLHESGHGMYEQGVDARLDNTPLGRGTSMAVHESQSRLWENIVGRSHGFWEFFYPRLQKRFPEQLGSVPLQEFHRAINSVRPSLIRTDADEVTYNLHVVLRFDFELELLEGRMEVEDLPEAWRERMKADLGVLPPNDREGVLQDSHWYNGLIGGRFQGYALGNILSAQFYAAAIEAHPEIPAEIRDGEFGTLHDWLSRNIYQYGSKYTPEGIIESATGASMSTSPYMDYLESKYGKLYSIEAH